MKVLPKAAKKWLNRRFPMFYKSYVDRLNGYHKLRRQILDDARRNPQMYDGEVIERLKKRGVEIFPFAGAERYDTMEVEVYLDGDGFPWVWHGNKKLFFRRGTAPEAVSRTYCRLLKEQDPASPHHYKFVSENGGTLLDIGAAEGIYSLDNVDVAIRIILFEVNPEWIGALERTFALWSEKVTIINKFASDRDSETEVRIDAVVRETDGPLLLKLDVEGAEKRVLNGAEATLARPDTRAVVCTYHRDDDHRELSELMRDRRFDVTTSRGWMLFIFAKDLQPPFFRRGVIYCCK